MGVRATCKSRTVAFASSLSTCSSPNAVGYWARKPGPLDQGHSISIPRVAKRKRPSRCFHRASLDDGAIARNETYPRLILGINQYSHDAGVAVVDADTGEVLFALAKERLSRRKHDGGAIGSVVYHAFKQILQMKNLPGAPDSLLRAVCSVVANNHHFPIRPFERSLPFAVGSGFASRAHVASWNLVGEGDCKTELSHHLAHVYSAVHTAPFAEGLVVIMDGMGDSRDAWRRKQSSYASASPSGADRKSGQYVTDFDICVHDRFREFPAAEEMDRAPFGHREAESAYVFAKSNGRIHLERLFKRWTPEISPPELYNHGFHDMQSVGAVYSRCATHIFGDWNACGKVMGLAPYCSAPSTMPRQFMSGSLFDGSFKVCTESLHNLARPNEWAAAEFGEQGEHGEHGDLRDLHDTSTLSAEDLRGMYIGVAGRVQLDLEATVLDLLGDLKAVSGKDKLVFAGGVALNSTLNGRIVRESGFSDVYIPPFPGDEGIAVGCALYGLHSWTQGPGNSSLVNDGRGDIAGVNANTALCMPIAPYFGTLSTHADIANALQGCSSWVEAEVAADKDSFLSTCVDALCRGEVLAWYQGRSECGPRALGNRSILADPRQADMVDHLNLIVKRREAFRPFAPSCLLSEVGRFFGEDSAARSSPYMSATATLKASDDVPGVSHIDQTARLQTLERDVNSVYYDLIARFREATGVGMVLNTSFNLAGEPIVDCVDDAVLTFLEASGIAALALPDVGMFVRRRHAPLYHEDDTSVFVECPTSFSSTVERTSTGEVRRVTVTMPRNYLRGGREDDAGDDDADQDDETEEMLAVEDGHVLSRSIQLESETDLELLETVSNSVGGISLAELRADVESSLTAGMEAGYDDDGDDVDDVCDDAGEADAYLQEAIGRLWRDRLIRVDVVDRV